MGSNGEIFEEKLTQGHSFGSCRRKNNEKRKKEIMGRRLYPLVHSQEKNQRSNRSNLSQESNRTK